MTVYQVFPAPAPTGSAPASVRRAVSLMCAGAAVYLICGFILAPIWILMAWKCKAGRPWARIVSTVLFGLGTLETLVVLATPPTSDRVVLGLIAGWLAGLGATVLLWRRPSSRYFGAASRYQDPDEW